MPRSMTGFGQADNAGYHVEIKGLNHRYQEIRVKLPRDLQQLEMPVREVVSKAANRGKVDVFITVHQGADQQPDITFNREFAASCHKELELLAERFGGEVCFRDVMWIPGVMTERPRDMEEQWTGLRPAVEQALARFNESKQVEGERLKDDMLTRIENLLSLRDTMAGEAQCIPEQYRERLLTRLEALLPEDCTIDEQRLAQEVAVLVDKGDITEELVRLASHLQTFGEVLDTNNEPVGRRLDFMLQEINREINTIGSKSQATVLSHLVIDAKTEVEKVREQVQNIE